jgi:hypothetical protein
LRGPAARFVFFAASFAVQGIYVPIRRSCARITPAKTPINALMMIEPSI